MKVAMTIPLNHPEFESYVLDTVCNPAGYQPLVYERYKNTDIYNACLFRLLMKFNNTGAPDEVLYDMPMPLWSGHW
jgi:hypothetical protein